jgi:hypothetical protein
MLVTQICFDFLIQIPNKWTHPILPANYFPAIIKICVNPCSSVVNFFLIFARKYVKIPADLQVGKRSTAP